jgi:cyclohexanone monooxygenase
VEATKEAEDAWVDLLFTKGRPAGRADCTPGYYNNEGQPRPESKLNVGYPQGATAFFTMLERWRQSGTFDGLSFS